LVGKVVFGSVNSFCPIEFFGAYNRSLLLMGDFKREILPLAKVIGNLRPVAVSVLELKVETTDSTIVSRLPEGYTFEISELCARLAQATRRNSFMDGKEHLFYPTSKYRSRASKRVVSISWNKGAQKWVLDARRFDLMTLSPGHKVIPRVQYD
ncbi:MAG: hypothetical protein V1711_00145, partial [bacterium]